MKKLNYFFSLVLSSFVLLTGCQFDDKEIWDELNDLDGRVSALEQWSKTVNTNINALQGLVSALENDDYITGITPVMEGGVEVGYTITFTKSTPITIFHGKKGDQGNQGEKGDDGLTPIIAVRQDTDGKYYWTLGGDWLMDGGDKIPATGEKGDKGDAGESAYALAVAGGYQGTLTQWIESLKGVNGTNGENGANAYQLAVAGGFCRAFRG